MRKNCPRDPARPPAGLPVFLPDRPRTRATRSRHLIKADDVGNEAAGLGVYYINDDA